MATLACVAIPLAIPNRLAPGPIEPAAMFDVFIHEHHHLAVTLTLSFHLVVQKLHSTLPFPINILTLKMWFKKLKGKPTRAKVGSFEDPAKAEWEVGETLGSSEHSGVGN